MKTFFTIIAAILLCSCNKTVTPQFLVLDANQLKPLGIDLNGNGVFYRNLNPNWKQDSARFSGLAFYSSADNYLTTLHFSETDTLKAANRSDSLLAAKQLSRNDFYPVEIGDSRGNQSLQKDGLSATTKLLPVAICMAETKLAGRKDTIVVWFNHSESLKQALPKDIRMDNYLRSPVRK